MYTAFDVIWFILVGLALYLGFDVYHTAGLQGNFTPAILCAILALLVDFRILQGLGSDEADRLEAQAANADPKATRDSTELPCAHELEMQVLEAKVALMQPIVDAVMHHAPYMRNPPEEVSASQLVTVFLGDVWPHVDYLAQRYYSAASNADNDG